MSTDGNKSILDTIITGYYQKGPICLGTLDEIKKIDESKITFPIQLKEWVVTISPTDKDTIMEYFKIDGIKKVVEEKLLIKNRKISL